MCDGSHDGNREGMCEGSGGACEDAFDGACDATAVGASASNRDGRGGRSFCTMDTYGDLGRYWFPLFVDSSRKTQQLLLRVPASCCLVMNNVINKKCLETTRRTTALHCSENAIEYSPLATAVATSKMNATILLGFISILLLMIELFSLFVSSEF